MTRVRRWECDQCGAHITDKGRLYRVKLEEPGSPAFVGQLRPPIRCRKKDMCQACYDKVLAFLKGKMEEEK